MHGVRYLRAYKEITDLSSKNGGGRAWQEQEELEAAAPRRRRTRADRSLTFARETVRKAAAATARVQAHAKALAVAQALCATALKVILVEM
ncbi:hypothetical protein SEUCBS139899_002159 [Sporothrix eucalyptigena]